MGSRWGSSPWWNPATTGPTAQGRNPRGGEHFAQGGVHLMSLWPDPKPIKNSPSGNRCICHRRSRHNATAPPFFPRFLSPKYGLAVYKQVGHHRSLRRDLCFKHDTRKCSCEDGDYRFRLMEIKGDISQRVDVRGPATRGKVGDIPIGSSVKLLPHTPPFRAWVACDVSSLMFMVSPK